jgi:hypothetical protein
MEGNAMKTVKVRIALEIAPDGQWQASGSSFFDDTPASEAWDLVMDGHEPLEGHHVKRHWIDVEVPVPDAEPEVIAGKATEPV